MNLKKMEEIIEKGIDLNICSLLYIIREEGPINTQVPKIEAIVNMMERKGLIKEGRITSDGEDIIKFLESGEAPVKEKSKIEDIEGIYDRLQAKLLELTGNKQKKVDIFGKTYNYFPGKYDFVQRFRKVVNKYKIKDYAKAEKVLLHNLEVCKKTNKWYPLLIYYLVKDDISVFATDYESWEENKKTEQEYDGTNI